jgi:hypothetical protein
MRLAMGSMPANSAPSSRSFGPSSRLAVSSSATGVERVENGLAALLADFLLALVKRGLSFFRGNPDAAEKGGILVHVFANGEAIGAAGVAGDNHLLSFFRAGVVDEF